MAEFLVILKAVFVITFIMILFSAVGFWIFIGYKKYRSNIKYFLKYKILRMKIHPKEIELINHFIEKDINLREMKKILLINHGLKYQKVQDLEMIYKNMKGGVKNE